MKKPFTDSIVGSWLFIRSTHPDFYHGLIHHFTKNFDDISDIPLDGKRYRHTARYSLSGSTLTMLPTKGEAKDFNLSYEEDGSVCVSREGTHTWWMRRLTSSETDSLGFVDENGVFQKTQTEPAGSSNSPSARG